MNTDVISVLVVTPQDPVFSGNCARKGLGPGLTSNFAFIPARCVGVYPRILCRSAVRLLLRTTTTQHAASSCHSDAPYAAVAISAYGSILKHIR